MRSTRSTWTSLLSLLCCMLACSDDEESHQKNPVDEKAASHATAVMTGDEAALAAAMNEGGFDLADGDGNVVESSAEQRQGTAWDAWDIAMMARTVTKGGFVTVRDLAEALTVIAPGVQVDQLVEAILTDIRVDAESDLGSVRARARLIVELGKLAQPPYDLLDTAVGGEARFNSVQLGLVMQTLATGVAVNTPSAAGQALRAQSARPCTITDTESFILDVDAALSGKGVGAVLEVLEGAGWVSKTVAERLELVNILLTYLKFIWAMMSFDMQVHVQPDELVRSKNRDYGGTADIMVDARLNVGDAQLINCIRPALTKFGIDMSSFNDGPIANAIVDWEPESFPVSNNGSGECIEFAPGVFGSVPGHSHATRTDAAGHTSIALRGRPQLKKLADRSERDPRNATINIILKMKDADLKSDILDALGGLPSAPAEMAYRMGWGTTELFAFEVIDWTDPCRVPNTPSCDAAWVCSVSFSASGSQSFPQSGANGQSHFEQDDIYTYDASGVIEAKVAYVQGAPFTEMTASGNATLTHTQVFTSHVVDSSCTTDNTSSTEETMTGPLSVGGGTNGFFSMSFVDQAGPYQITVTGLSGTLSGTSHEVGSLTHSGTDCPPDNGIDETTPLTELLTTETLAATGTTSLGPDGKVTSVHGEQSTTVATWMLDAVNYAFNWTCEPVE